MDLMLREAAMGLRAPCMITGYMNQHPKDAMEWMEGMQFKPLGRG
jgi:hypothetical protein